MKVQKKIDVYLVKKRNTRPIEIVQIDTGIQLEFTVKDFEIPTGTTATLFVQKPSGKFVYQEKGVTVSGNTITIDLENQAIVEKGNLPYQVGLKNGTDEITTFEGLMMVYRSLKDSGAEESKTVIRAFDELTAEQIAKIQSATLDQIALVQQASQNEQKSIEDKGIEVRATIPEDYQATYNMANEAIRTKADAIVQTVQGETIVVSDASDDYLRNLKVFGKSTQETTTGKNLLPFGYKDESNTSNGVASKVNNNGSISFSGNATGYAGVALYEGPVSIFPEVITIFALGSFDNVVLHIVLVDKNGSTILETNVTNTSNFRTLDFSQYTDVDRITINAKRYTTGTVSGTVYPMVVSGRLESVEYEPYTGGKPSPSPEFPQPIESIGDDGSINVGVYGKNLIEIIDKNVTSNGITLTIEKGKISIIGNPLNTTGHTIFDVGKIYPNKAGIYTSSMIGKINGIGIAYSYASSLNITMSQSSNKQTSTLTSDIAEQKVVINVSNELGTVDWEGYIQLEKGSEATEYEPYTKQSLSVSTLNGLPAIKVADASLATYTDADGNMWCADEVACGEKKIQRVDDIVFDGTEGGWSLYESATYTGFKITISSMKPNMRTNGLCSHFKPQSYPANSSNNGVTFGASNSVIYFTFSEERFSTVDDWKAYLAEQYANGTPVTVKYILPEPIETDLTADEIEAFKALHSNYPNTTVMNDCNAWTEVSYNADTKKYIDNKFAALAAQML